MSFILEWISFQNEDRTAFTWQNRPAQPKTFSRARFSRQIKNKDGARKMSAIWKTIRVRHSPQTTQFAVSSRNGVRFQFTWHQNENFILIEISSRYRVNRYREINGDGMNAFWNESHSGAQRSCKNGTVMRHAKMKCNKRFIKVDSPNSQFILKLSASLYYSLSVNFFSEMFIFFKERHSCSHSFYNR